MICTHPTHPDHSSHRPDLLFRAGTGVVVMAAALAMSGCGGSSAGAQAPVTDGGSQSASSAGTSAPVTSAAASSATTTGSRVTTATVSRGGATRTATTTSSAAQGTALAALATLPVKGRAPKTGYSRAAFGQAWADVDHNGCDTRNDILARDLRKKTLKSGTHGCIVTSGVLNDPYTAKVIHFTRGEKTSTAVQIDHVVALSDAWQTGAQKLSASTREQLANDPLELLAVDGPTNETKSDGDAATWLPANKSFRCQYVARQVEVKVHYKLWVTRAEHDAIAHVLSGCRTQKLPTAGAPIMVWKASGSVATKTPVKKASAVRSTKTSTAKKVVKKATSNKAVEKATAGKSSSVYYKNCAAARKAGAAPLHKGSAGYRSGLDRDHDGVACE